MPHTSDDLTDDGIDNPTKNHPQDWDCGGGVEVFYPGTIMGGNSRMAWSPCSVMAFRKYYTQMMTTNEWCMQGKKKVIQLLVDAQPCPKITTPLGDQFHILLF